MLTDEQIKKVMTEHFYWWEANKYEPEYPSRYTSAVELALAFDDHVQMMDDLDIIGLFWDENGEDEISNDDIRLVRATITEQTDGILRLMNKSIFAYPTKVFLGA
jgi:hypothetical protein